MSRLLTISSRLPVTVERVDGALALSASVGGVATGMSSVVDNAEARWLGWAELPDGTSAEEAAGVESRLKAEHRSWPVFLDAETATGFYDGFANRTLWPLFHQFMQTAEFEPAYWDAYKAANEAFCERALDAYEPGDTIWIHDYQLMLLPSLLREQLPDASIGFFLHIPFPDFETFRVLPWRRELLSGLLGANLVGFHTYDYVRHFLNCSRILLGLEERRGRLDANGRVVVADAFPMGIDVERFASATSDPAVRACFEDARAATGEGGKLVLSVDRLDYTKGIPERIKAFGEFLDEHPEWHERVRLIMLAVPTRTRVDSYADLRTEVEQLVGEINGRFGSVAWTPVQLLVRSMPFEELAGLYAAADVGLVTPLRDGMNLVAKEYVATRCHTGPGVLVLSEMAGAARELSEALLVNPYDRGQTADAIYRALEMTEGEARRRMTGMDHRLRRYDVRRWADDFLSEIEVARMHQVALGEHELTVRHGEELLAAARDAEWRTIVLDYDGTLVPFAARPEEALPDSELTALLGRLALLPKTAVAIVSGRDRFTLESWFSDLGVALAAEHGAWTREADGEWTPGANLDSEWKDAVRPMLESLADRTPGAFLEEKEYALAWHYRNADPDQAAGRRLEALERLDSVVARGDMVILEGDMVLEIKPASVDKGRAAHRWMAEPSDQFLLVAGDDVTDESLFEAAPLDAWTLKVGGGPTRAKFTLNSWREMRDLLTSLAEVTE